MVSQLNIGKFLPIQNLNIKLDIGPYQLLNIVITDESIDYSMQKMYIRYAHNATRIMIGIETTTNTINTIDLITLDKSAVSFQKISTIEDLEDSNTIPVVASTEIGRGDIDGEMRLMTIDKPIQLYIDRDKLMLEFNDTKAGLKFIKTKNLIWGVNESGILSSLTITELQNEDINYLKDYFK